ncbi:MAG: LysE family translocator [Candidatus Kariarchaeaceae archaeon]
MNLTDILLLMSLGFSLAAPLGPINLELLKQTLSRSKGWIFGLMTGFGAMTGDFIIAMTAMYLGEEKLSEAIEISAVKYSLLVVNVLILFYISWGAWNAKIVDDFMADTEGKEIGNSSISTQYSKGFLMVMSSPWSYFWWVSFGSYLLGRGIDLSSFTDKLTATFFFLIGILFWLLFFCVLLAFSRKMANAKTLEIITKSSAIVIVMITIIMVIDFLA